MKVREQKKVQFQTLLSKWWGPSKISRKLRVDKIVKETGYLEVVKRGKQKRAHILIIDESWIEMWPKDNKQDKRYYTEGSTKMSKAVAELGVGRESAAYGPPRRGGPQCLSKNKSKFLNKKVYNFARMFLILGCRIRVDD